jgi:hypothetical protein
LNGYRRNYLPLIGKPNQHRLIAVTLSIFIQLDPLRHSHDLHALGDYGPARHNGLFFVTVLEPDLTVQAFAIPAKIAIRDALHREVLKASEQRIVLWDHVLGPDDLDLDEAVKGLEYVGKGHKL